MISSAKQRLIMYFNRYSSGKPIENTTGTTLISIPTATSVFSNACWREESDCSSCSSITPLSTIRRRCARSIAPIATRSACISCPAMRPSTIRPNSSGESLGTSASVDNLSKIRSTSRNDCIRLYGPCSMKWNAYFRSSSSRIPSMPLNNRVCPDIILKYDMTHLRAV